ncbi:hypothetical protein [Human papillomavirus type 41]|uniref:Protein E7 n=1 Tax=Human papillomavirus type 41 TaxID=10589 RepID=VE7_HPV41|nr:hypothetical protein [Human papillomavirus type 41]P27556.1 RecName: Full=Protein E7 [Human papillomavirus type 41]CAA39613.1 ORF E7 [Human papillomavirus type 41]
MRGNSVDLQEIVLVQQGEVPENAAVHSGEHSDDEGESEEEEREQVQQVPTPRRTLYLVESQCPFCQAIIRFVCVASNTGIRNLQALLVNSHLDLACHACVEQNGVQGLRHRQWQ